MMQAIFPFRPAAPVAALALATLLAGCFSSPVATIRPAPQVATPAPGESDTKVWARIDGRRMAGNPTLMRQGQQDLTECRAQTEITPGSKLYDLVALEACMNTRGYQEIPRPA